MIPYNCTLPILDSPPPSTHIARLVVVRNHHDYRSSDVQTVETASELCNFQTITACIS